VLIPLSFDSGSGPRLVVLADAIAEAAVLSELGYWAVMIVLMLAPEALVHPSFESLDTDLA
jgi:hypothetical protein